MMARRNPVTAAAAGVTAIDTVFVDIRNAEGLRAECKAAVRDGFSGKMAIHPAQVPVINEVFTPSAEEVARARRIVDYFAANPGAGVVAIAAGEVKSASYSGASGNMGVIRHDGGFESMYLHLSGFKVRAGQRVGQGDVIGFVGNTGRVTGTHLDFRMRQNGRYLNPLTLFRSLPPGDPIPARLMAAFEAERDRLLGEITARVTAAAAAAGRPAHPNN
mgnify:CR=1 FL=1